MVGSTSKNTQIYLIFQISGCLFASTKLFLGSENIALFPLQCSTFSFLNSKGILLFRLQEQQEEHLLV